MVPRPQIRIRLNSDYAEVCVKPRICGDGLRSWGVLADSSA
jgi:putative transposase